MPKKALAMTLALAACGIEDGRSRSTHGDNTLPTEVQAEFEQLREIAPQLFANTTLIAAAQLEFDRFGQIDSGEVIARIDNFNCSFADEILVPVEGGIAEYPEIEFEGRIETFLKSLSENNAAIIRDVTESGIRYSFEVDCDRAPEFDLLN